MSVSKTRKDDFFISYTSVNADIAEWITWQLEEAGYSVIFQKWDIIPGSSFVVEMRGALEHAHKMVAVISEAYFQSKFAMSEWDAAFAEDPDGMKRNLIPVRVEDCDVKGLAKPRVYIDIVGCDENTAKQKLLGGVKGTRQKPTNPPKYPLSEQAADLQNTTKHKSDKPQPAMFSKESQLIETIPPQHLEQLIHQKAYAEFEAKRLLGETVTTIAADKLVNEKIQKEWKGKSAPHRVMDEAINLRVKNYLVPLITERIEIEVELHRAAKSRMNDDVAGQLRAEIYVLIDSIWDDIVWASYNDTLRYVSIEYGPASAYKVREIDKKYEGYTRGPSPSAQGGSIFEIVEHLITKATIDLKV